MSGDSYAFSKGNRSSLYQCWKYSDGSKLACFMLVGVVEIARSSREDEEYGLVDPSWKNESSNFKVFKWPG